MFGIRDTRDETAITAVLSGKSDEFGVLVQRYLPVVQAIAYASLGGRHDIGDIAQEAFLRAYQNLDRLRERHKFGAWLATIIRNLIARTKRDFSKLKEAAETPAISQVVEAPDFARIELRNAVRDQIQNLDEDAREALMLHYFAGKSSREIAAIIDQPDATIRKRLQRAREALGERLLAEFAEDDATTRSRQRQTRKILGAVLAGGASWTAANAAVAGGGVAGPVLMGGSGFWGIGGAFTAKTVLGFAAALAVCTLTVVAVKNYPSRVEQARAQSSVAGNTASRTPPAAIQQASSTPRPASAPLPGAGKEPGIPVSGKVTRSNGTPVPGATVLGAYRGHKPTVPRASGKADANGAFTLYLSEPWPQFPMWAETEGFVALEHVCFDVPPAGANGVTCVLFRQATVRGQIVGENGAPLPGRPISAVNHDEKAYQRVYSSKANEQGQFVFTGLPPGNYGFSASESPAAIPELATLDVKEGDEAGNLRIVVAHGGESFIAGHVRGEDGKSLKGASVQISSQIGAPATEFTALVKADEHGVYRIDDVPPGEYSPTAYLRGYESQDQYAAAGSNDVDFVLRRLARVSGIVIDAATKQPLTEFEVGVAGAHTTSLKNEGDALLKRVKEKDGRFQLDDVQLGETTIVARSKSRMPAFQPVDLSPGQMLEGVTIELSRGFTLSGTVVDKGGNPVFGAAVKLGYVPHKMSHESADFYSEKISHAALAVTAADGTFSVSGLAPGPLTLGVYHPAHGSGSVQVTMVAPLGHSPVRVVLAKGGAVRGVVRLGGAPLEGAFVVAGGAEGQRPASDEAKTKSNGGFTLDDVSPGETTVQAKIVTTATDMIGRTLIRTATVVAGQETTLDFDFAADTGALEGQIEGLGNAKYAASVWCGVTLPGGKEMHFTLSRDGRFSFQQIPAGTIEGVVTVAPAASGALMKHFDAAIRVNETTPVTVRFSGNAEISGTVSGIRAGERAWVVATEGNVVVTTPNPGPILTSVKTSRASADIASDGSFYIGGLEGGVYTVMAAAVPSENADTYEGARFVTSAVTLPEAGNTTVNFALK